MIMYSLARKLSMLDCYRCKKEIDDISDFTIDHKKGWVNVSPALFWDMNNIAFSHATCNFNAGKTIPCPSLNHYRNGCRCDPCIHLKRKYDKKYRDRKRLERQLFLKKGEE